MIGNRKIVFKKIRKNTVMKKTDSVKGIKKAIL